MKRLENMNLGGDSVYGYGHRSGSSILLYERSLYWFVRYMHPILVSVRSNRKRTPLLCGEISLGHLKQLQRKRRLRSVEESQGRFRWCYAQQVRGNQEDFSGFSEWRGVIFTPPAIRHERSSDMNAVVNEILSFDPSQRNVTQIVEAIDLWQKRLKPEIRLGNIRPASS